jgi:4-hydroxybenzoyl-CoA thioesterase
MTTSHRVPLEVSFKHCDPAGIVFYPRYVEMLNDVVEHWFRHGLGCDFLTLHGPRGMAVPVANLEVDFKAPSVLGDTLLCQLTVQHVGKSSLHLQVDVFGNGLSTDAQIRLSAKLTLVFVGMKEKRPIAIPSDLREVIGTYLVDRKTKDMPSSRTGGCPDHP